MWASVAYTQYIILLIGFRYLEPSPSANISDDCQSPCRICVVVARTMFAPTIFPVLPKFRRYSQFASLSCTCDHDEMIKKHETDLQKYMCIGNPDPNPITHRKLELCGKIQVQFLPSG